MKTRIFFLTLAVMISGLSFSQNNTNEDNSKCEAIVIKKIKRKLNLIDMNDYMKIGDKSRVILTCEVNSDNQVEVLNIQGVNEGLKKAVLEILKEHPVECKNQKIDSPFSFTVKFMLFPQ